MRSTLCADKKKCGIEIGSLEMFIADFAHNNDLKSTQPSSKLRGKVAVIGSGPAGLTVAGDLAKMDFDVTIFEAQSEPGGVLLFGIPEFRLQRMLSAVKSASCNISVWKSAPSSLPA